MITYDNLVNELSILLDDQANLPLRFKGLYIEIPNKEMILLNKHLESNVERKCILAEEIGHHHKTSGYIVDQTTLNNRKQEYIARKWAFEKLVPLEGILSAYKSGVSSRHELAEHFDVLEDFLEQALEHYRRKYGLFINLDDKHTIFLDPLWVDQYQ